MLNSLVVAYVLSACINYSNIYAVYLSDDALVATLPEGLRDKAYAGISYSLATIDPITALEVAQKIQNREDQPSITSSIFAQWYKIDKSKALAKLKLMEVGQFEALGLAGLKNADGFIQALAKDNPETLKSFLGSIIPQIGNKQLFGDSIRIMAAADLGSSLQMISDLPEGKLKDGYIELAFSVGANQNKTPADLSGTLAKLTGENRAKALDGLGTAAANQSLERVLEISSWLEEKDKSRFLTTALGNITEKDFETVVQNIAIDDFKGQLAVEDSKKLTQDTASRLTVKDPDRALSWYGQLPQNSKVPAMRGLATELARNDINRLAGWLNSLNKNDEWAAGAEVLAAQLEYTDSKAASEWRKSVSEYSNLDGNR